jgi:hypothetical protein
MQVLPYAMAGEAADGALRICDMQIDSPLKARYCHFLQCVYNASSLIWTLQYNSER